LVFASTIASIQPDSPVCLRDDIDGYVRYNDELPRFALLSRNPAR